MSRETAVRMKGDQPLSRDELAQRLRIEMERLMTADQLISEHREAVDRFKAAQEGTQEYRDADAALVASFARLADRLSEDGEPCAFLRRQAE